MEEEVKATQDTQSTESKEEKKISETLKTALKFILGGVLVIVGIVLVIIWWKDGVWPLIKGCLGPFLILAGAITIAIAKE